MHGYFDISADRDNKVLIITGTGGEFIAVEQWDKPYDRTVHWDQIYWEGKRVLQHLLDIDIPVIGAINGPAHVHAEIGVLSDITLCAEHATFQDLPHVPGGVVPGDGVSVVWQELLGPNRGRYFLLTGQILTAHEALELGVVNEVLPRERLMDRAREHAERLLRMPEVARRYRRVVLTERMRRLIREGTGCGLMLEGPGIEDALQNPRT